MITEFDKHSTWNKRGKPAVVNIDDKGRIGFSVEAVRLLNMSEWDAVAFRIDARDKDVIYFCRRPNSGFPLHTIKCKNGIRLQVNCRPLTVKLLAHFGYKENKTFKLTADQVRIENFPYWHMILKTNLHQPLKWRRK